MKTRFRFLTYGLFALAVSITSCEKEGPEGPIGPAGAMGEQGIAGPAGPAGEDGEALGVPGPQGTQGETGATGPVGPQGETGDTGPVGPQGPAGPAGADGTNGSDGADGNANVQTFIYDVSTRSGASINVSASVLTQDVLDNDLVLGYLKKNGGNYTPIPAPIYAVALGDNYDIAVELHVGTYWMFFYTVGTENLKSISAGKLDELKLVIAESTSTTVGKSSKQSILSKMKSEGVDINDYYAVMDYFGLDY